MTVNSSRYVAILDVGHGNCCVLKDDTGVLVIDTGLGTSLLEFLKEREIECVDVVLLSHADQDHISGLVQLLASKEFSIGRVRLNTDAAKSTKLWKNLVHELETQESKGKLNWEVQLTADSGEEFSQGRVQVEVLSPGKALAATGPGSKTENGRQIKTNSVSCVIRLSQDGQAIAVLSGDVDDVGLADLIRRFGESGQALDAPLLVYPHHGGSSGPGDPAEFARNICDVFNPSTVIFSIGRGKHGTPRPEVVEAIRRSVKDLRIACTQLSKHCSQDLPDEKPDHLLPLYADGRQNGSCCAGTMLINLDSVDNLLPLRDVHEAFVARIASTALCQRNFTMSGDGPDSGSVEINLTR